MFHLDEVLELKDEENVKGIVRRHPVTLVPALVVAGIVIVVPFFFLFPLFQWGVPGAIIFFAAILAGVVIAGRAVLLWDADVLVITTMRLVDVDQRGVFSRFVTEAPISSIQDVAWRKLGIVDTVFRIGTVTVTANGVSTKLEIARVAHPERISEIVNDLRHATSPKRTDVAPDRQERLKKMMRQLEELSPEALDRVESTLSSAGKKDAIDGFLKHPVHDAADAST